VTLRLVGHCRPAGRCWDPNRRVTEDMAADKLRRRPGGSGWQQGAAHRECQPTLAADCSYLSTAREPCPRSSRWIRQVVQSLAVIPGARSGHLRSG